MLCVVVIGCIKNIFCSGYLFKCDILEVYFNEILCDEGRRLCYVG